MKTGLIILLSFALAGCQLTPAPESATPTQPIAEMLPEQTIAPEPEQPSPAMSINDDATTLQVWVNYRADMLQQVDDERERLNQQPEQDAIWQLKRTILQLHPDTPYLTRLRVQMQLSDQLATLPTSLAALFSWDLAFNQKLLEAESAVSALTRLNSQQHDNIERLQRTNKELQKKIDALTQIEAQLNQPATVQEDNNGKF
ncbi:hypothetical protein [Rheinheimera baltica]|uniref:YfhG lipoprotein n=1 Tax=Rheinheimera baltica TaxID=67576 RepID=A0ABT9HX90_9GAMM|nr:hypothetical protein [Rheinheimera baltica]MDP5135748.1 hypothetical protein [Rheinheimera baltica]MDP5142373.1 hypothetical protein [Rheinheimera baltica]MDP5150725.1 hypothetical protein [Rheinheimera baltica]MDP5192114.1 hypothetical protein [Rheinheimera baltica]